MSEKMTPEEYLLARGWNELDAMDGVWSHPRRVVDDRVRWFDLNEAVEEQLAEDRAIMAFVMDRSAVTLLLPTDVKGISSVMRPTVRIGPKEGA